MLGHALFDLLCFGEGGYCKALDSFANWRAYGTMLDYQLHGSYIDNVM